MKMVPVELPVRSQSIQRRQSNVNQKVQNSDSVRPVKEEKDEEGEEQEDDRISNKRPYIHHPKPDANAPIRPYSAYVLFANEMREQLKDENLPFPELSRRIGMLWQRSGPEGKKHWQQRAAVPWKTYKKHLSAYQETDQHREYQRYAEDFKIKQAGREHVRPVKQRKRQLPASSKLNASQAPASVISQTHTDSRISQRTKSWPSISGRPSVSSLIEESSRLLQSYTELEGFGAHLPLSNRNSLGESCHRAVEMVVN